MAHLQKRNGKYRICVEKGRDPVTGKRERIYETVDGTKREAEERLHELAYKIKSGKYPEDSESSEESESSGMTVKEILNNWYENYCKINLAESTQEYYQVIINSHLIPVLGHILVSDLKPIYIQNYILDKTKDGRLDGKEGGLSKKSVKRHYTVLNQSLKYAVELKVIDKNPAKPASPPSPDKPEIIAMTQNQLNKLLNKAKEDKYNKGWLYDFLYIAAHTGMRRGELLALRWQDIDFKEKSLQVKQSVSKLSGGRLLYKRPKTESSSRPVIIDDSIIKILRKRHKEQKENKLEMGDKYNTDYNLVFLKPNGDPYLPDYASKQFKKVATQSDLNKFRLHDLRHTHATLMLKANIHPKVVQERLGHSSIDQTLNTYSHVTPSMQHEALEKYRNKLENNPGDSLATTD